MIAQDKEFVTKVSVNVETEEPDQIVPSHTCAEITVIAMVSVLKDLVFARKDSTEKPAKRQRIARTNAQTEEFAIKTNASATQDTLGKIALRL